MVVQVEERPGAALSGNDLIGAAPPSEAGPVDEAGFDAGHPCREPARCERASDRVTMIPSRGGRVVVLERRG